MTSLLTREEQGRRHSGDSNMKTEAETGVMLTQAKGCLEPPEAGRGKNQRPFQSLWRGHNPANTLTLDFQPPEW